MRSRPPARRTAALARKGASAPPLRAETPFVLAVARVVRRIPRGTTLGYGEVALRAGKPGAARLAVRALNRLDDVPWWRVSRSDGTLAPAVAHDQEQLLRAEGWPGPPVNPKRRNVAGRALGASPAAGRTRTAPVNRRGSDAQVPPGPPRRRASRAE